jgi:beta-lactam-binding protein with PASTA domain
VAVGSTVNLVISTGPPSVVPELRGDTLAAARRALRAAGLALGQVNQGQGPAGLVVAQAARPGRTLRRGTAIAIVVGTTPPGNSGTSSSSGNTAANTPGT